MIRLFTISAFALLLFLPQTAQAQSIFSRFSVQNHMSPIRPTLSPYLALSRDDLSTGAGLPNYQALVRPALEQYRQNQQNRKALTELKRQAGESRNFRTIQNPGQGIRATGHPTRHRNFLHFFPQFGRLSDR